MDDQTIICECLKVTAGEIREAVKSGCMDVQCISSKTEAGTACRQCRSYDDDKKNRRQHHILEEFLQS